jgi:uncharacterized repeat protein (TIGR03803 family)
MKDVKNLKKLVAVLTAALAMAATLAGTVSAQAGQFKVLHEFVGNFDGLAPNGDLVMDSSGNLYGTTFGGGIAGSDCTNGCGTVFELSPNGSGGWTMKTIHRFTGKTDGGEPVGAIVMDASGNLYGTNQNGGVFSLSCPFPGCGTVFELSPNGSGGWTESTILTFNSANGSGPWGLIQDASGNLYGVASAGGSAQKGLVYELSPASGGGWSQAILHDFGGDGVGSPVSRLLLDANGNLLGTLIAGGVITGNCKPIGGCGGVFELSPALGGWTSTEFLFTTRGAGFGPRGNIVEDASGNFYGTTFNGGGPDDGIIFKLVPTPGEWTESLIHIFNGTKGASPEGLTSDGNGGFYGVALGGGNTTCNDGCGMIYDLTPGSSGGWVENILHRFSGLYDGGNPNDNLMVDGSGNIFGATADGGSTNCPAGCGTVFEISAPSPTRK